MTAQDMILSLTARGMSQKEIAALTDIGPWTLSRWASSGAPPAAQSALTLQRIYSESVACKAGIARLKLRAAA